MNAVPVRTRRGPVHLSLSTGRGYRTACGRTLVGAELIVPPRHLWAHVWALELPCKKCAAIADQARNERELARLAHW